MDRHHILLIIHLISATIWVGGHLILLLGFLPKALKHKNFDFISRFEKTYEPIGMPSLLLLVVTGIWIAYDLNAPLPSWFSFATGIETVVSLKILAFLPLFVLLSVLRQGYCLSWQRDKSKNFLKWRFIFYV